MAKREDAEILCELLSIEPVLIRESPYGTMDIWLREEVDEFGVVRLRDKIELVGDYLALTLVKGLKGPWCYQDFDGYSYLRLK